MTSTSFALPDTDPASLMSMVSSIISQSASSRTSRELTSSSSNIPSGITKKDYLIKYTKLVWYPCGRSQDFVIQCALRVQMFMGNGGEKKWVRMIVDDSNETLGFLNRGNLYFKERNDKGYFIGKVDVDITPSVDWITSVACSPATFSCGADGVDIDDYTPVNTESSTSFNVDYLDNGVKKTWTSAEQRSFRADEFCGGRQSTNGHRPGYGNRCLWSMFLALSCRNDEETHQLRDHYWNDMFHTYIYFASSDTADWPMQLSRGTGQVGIHPKMQAVYSVPSTETRSASFSIDFTQEVWNVWSKYEGVSKEYLRTDSATDMKHFDVDFKNLKGGKVALWSSGTYGNPGATIKMQEDGNLVIYSTSGQALWSSGTYGNPGATLKMQGDGNLVIYSKSGKALWATDTYGNPGASDVMQEDGNYVVYSAN